MAGLDKADKLASIIAVIVALVALLAPYLLPAQPPSATTLPPQSVVPEQPASPTIRSKIDLREAQGVQVNLAGENIQTNTFTEFS